MTMIVSLAIGLILGTAVGIYNYRSLYGFGCRLLNIASSDSDKSRLTTIPMTTNYASRFITVVAALFFSAKMLGIAGLIGCTAAFFLAQVPFYISLCNRETSD